jgi:hypothetical protein
VWADSVLPRRPLFWLRGSLVENPGGWQWLGRMNRLPRWRKRRGRIRAVKRLSRLETGDSPSEVEKQLLLPLAFLEQFAVGVGLLLQFEQLLVQQAGEGSGGIDRWWRRGSAAVWGRLRSVETAVGAFEIGFDREILAFPVVSTLAERPKQSVRRAAVLATGGRGACGG